MRTVPVTFSQYVLAASACQPRDLQAAEVAFSALPLPVAHNAVPRRAASMHSAFLQAGQFLPLTTTGAGQGPRQKISKDSKLTWSEQVRILVLVARQSRSMV